MPERDDNERIAWRANVGGPVAFDCDQAAAPALDCVDVLCWNVAIGRGRLEPLLTKLFDGAFATRDGPLGHVVPSPQRPLVILLQEAFRSDDSVPPTVRSRHHGGKVPAGVREDVTTVARGLGLSLRYTPSMRNGSHPSDRGNAVLATVPLAGDRTVTLPHVRQQRVVVSATLAGHPRLRFASAHLDTHGRPRGGSILYRPGLGRAAQARALGHSLARSGGDTLLGADLNSVLGMSDPAVRSLVDAGLRPARRVGGWRHTIHTPVRMLLDHVMFRSPDATVEAVDVIRLDEAPNDRSRRVFGSDHHPLLARVRFSGIR